MNSTRKMAVAFAALYVALALLQGPAWGKPLWVKKVKDLGYPAQNCLYCHAEKLPKKDSFKPDQLNDRGKWLFAKKQELKANEVDVEWLKDYPGGKEQK